ncbi:sugar phosphate isomerase/epimerase family protein [Amycolatopsis suaedae]|uniref:Sugar phosphate isomerase/epimerase n=1 Tax=Amycolatopsis suaedae TaxID=2510978 RepID=A0A4Q7JAQ4_9PSEU|nr:sugar phosphate isomerase/epimerase [Amycolatopsis suaedae]RZQ64138.1 sugar phosphate isomerase/epimerase [Amycolatopsis suaedae]
MGEQRFISRRSMLRGAGAAAVAVGAAVAVPGVAGATFGRRIPVQKISVQLYTLRSLLEKDAPGTLEALADIGYRSVEMAGTYGYSAAEFRKLLDRNHLRATSTHVGIDGDVDKLIADAKTLGHTYAAVPYAKYPTVAEWKALAARLDKAARAFHRAGIKLGYHNHDHEFVPVEGVRPYDILTRETDRRFVHLELDLFWAVHAGVDPVRLYWENFPRVLQYHVKDRTPDGQMTNPGTGAIDFRKIFRATPTIREYIVEHDNPTDPLETARVGFTYLRNLRF